MFFGLLGGYLPYDDPDKAKIMNRVLYEELDLTNSRWQKISSRAKNLLRGMLEKDKDRRLKIE
jgi:serine/threonine protein kinase